MEKPRWIDQNQSKMAPVFIVNMKPRTIRGLLSSIYSSKPGKNFRIVPSEGHLEDWDGNIQEFESKASKPMIKQYENGCVLYRLLLPSDDPADFTVIHNPKPPAFHRDSYGRITGSQRRDARGTRGPEQKYDTNLPKK